jgi:TorA maturation chaperone TorD
MAPESPSLHGPSDNGSASATSVARGVAVTDALDEATTVVLALDLLSHWWTRPSSGELAEWVEATGTEALVRERINHNSMTAAAPSLAVGPGDAQMLADEYERLFVGPGHVSCPPYESFWREDVPVDIRRSLMGPCTAQLRQLYQQLRIELGPATGEMPDHVAVELEALAYALTFDETVPIARVLFADHLRQWLPRLCRAVAHEATVDFYRDLAALSLDWLGYVQQHLASLAGEQPGTP